MKNMNDVHNIIKAKLNQWFPKQCNDLYSDYYLYYLPTTVEHNGGLLIAKERPANPEYCMVERVAKHLTIEENHRRIAEMCQRLPILEF